MPTDRPFDADPGTEDEAPAVIVPRSVVADRVPAGEGSPASSTPGFG